MEAKEASLDNKEKASLINQEAFLVDNSIEISNMSFTPKDFIETHNLITLILKE